MTDFSRSDGRSAAQRSNGLWPEPPHPGALVLVPGGAGYSGCVLVPRLLDRGYRVRVLDRRGVGPSTSRTRRSFLAPPTRRRSAEVKPLLDAFSAVL